jgi:NDP-sugar pyrophosphorylase family protein
VRAKAALPVAGQPLISRILEWLRNAGVRRVVLNLHHRPETITSIVGDGSQFDLRVRYSWEPEVLGSAGGPARALPLLESDRVLIVNGDTLTNVDLAALAAQHLDTNALVTMAVVDGDPRYNGVIADGNGIVGGFGKQPGAFHFIGVQVVNASVFAGVSPEVKSETVHGIYPALIAARPGAVRIFHTTEEFHDIGSPHDYLQTALKFSARDSRAVDRGRDAVVSPTAQLSNTVLWDRVVVGAGARLTNCVVADDVHVPEGAEHANCSLVMRGREMIVAPF